MDVAIVAPCPVPYQRGGAESLWRALQDHLNERTAHQAEIIKLPSREFEFFDLVDSYRAFAELDLRGFDVVYTSKYPAWMVDHPGQVCHMMHTLRGLYDGYHYYGLAETVTDAPAPVAELRRFMADHAGQRSALAELFERVDALRRRAASLPQALFAFPGPLIRELVHWLDRIGLGEARRLGAISATVRDRPGYFPAGAEVFVAHPPTPLRTRPARRRGGYVFTVSRLDDPKRIDLLVQAMAHVRNRRVRLRVAGTGPAEQRLQALAAGDDRIEFRGRVNDAELVGLYAGARIVAFCAYDEDFGYIPLEGMQAGKPIIACRDGGGPTELVNDGVTGRVVAATPEAIGAAIDELWSERRRTREMGRAGVDRAARVSWDAVVDELERAADAP